MAVDSFARLLLFKLMKGQGPTPSDNTTGIQYNALVDRVNNIDATLFAQGYDLLAVQPSGVKARAVAIQAEDVYVPVSEFNELDMRVMAIENLFSVPNAAVMQVKEIDGGDDIGPANIPHTSNKYVTEQEYEVLKSHVSDLENMLSNSAERIMLVSQ